jgi:hypothetical protein
MNQGIYGFPSTTGIALPNIISVTEFDANASYAIPPTAASLQILLIGGAGGGGGGAAGNNTNNASGGGAGSGGSIIYVDCLIVDDLPSTTLNVTIGAGGAGGSSAIPGTRAATNGGPGGNSSISMSGFPGLFIKAQGGGVGAASAAQPSAAGVAAGGAGKFSNFGFVAIANSSGQNGGFSTALLPVVILDARNNNGAGGGSCNTTPSPFTGGSIEIATNAYATDRPILYHLNLPLVGATFGITAALGGRINAGPTLGAGQNGRFMIGTSMKLLGGGIGGAGGGASTSATATLGGGNGGNGFRGGGGGGGGAARATGVPGGTGGNGGNGYCCIIAKM